MPSNLARSCLVSLIAASTLAAGCSGADDVGDDGEHYNCATEDRDEDFVAGMQKTGTAGMTFTLVSSDPAPPGRDNNTWVVEVSGGTPFEGEVLVTPFMPDHRHGTPIEAVVTPVAGTPGRYSVSPVNLWMPGLWEITVEAKPTPTTRDAAVFRFCING
jgi:hypothetical protein